MNSISMDGFGGQETIGNIFSEKIYSRTPGAVAPVVEGVECSEKDRQDCKVERYSSFDEDFSSYQKRIEQGRAFSDASAHTTARVAASPLKWVGGKGRLLPQLLPLLPRPAEGGTWHEPFVGAGSVWCAVQPARAILSDGNRRLAVMWRAIRDDVEGVIRELRGLARQHALAPVPTFMSVKTWDVDRLPEAMGAAWMLYVAQAGFNGLYRVNAKGRYNVDIGRRADKTPNPVSVDEEGLRSLSGALFQSPRRGAGKPTPADGDALQGVEVRHVILGATAGQGGLFGAAASLPEPKEGDALYADPPYLDTYAAYTGTPFDLADHRWLETWLFQSAERGVRVAVSNSDSEATRAIYGLDQPGGRWMAHRLTRPGTVSCDGDGRAAVTELLLVPRFPVWR